MRENRYQARLIRKLERTFPDCVILKNDSGYIQGILDLTILWGPRWGMLEVKTSEFAPYQPNQDYWVSHLNKMGFAAFIWPEIETEVLHALREALQPRR